MQTKSLNLLKKLEGFSSTPYKDVAGVWTIGYGTTFYLDGKKVTKNDTSITEKQAEIILKVNLKKFEDSVTKSLTVTLNSNQKDALVLFAYNVGIMAFRNSTLLKVINTNPNVKEVEVQLLRWVYSTVQGEKFFVQGLKNRRLAEIKLYFTPPVITQIIPLLIFFYTCFTVAI